MPSQGHVSRRKRWVRLILIIALPCLLVTAIIVYFWRFLPVNRAWVVATLERRYQCDVELKSFDASFYPVISFRGEGLVLKHRDRPDLPPLASVKSFSATGNWLSLLRQPRHFHQVRLEGLVIVVPPRGKPSAEKQNHEMRHEQNSQFVLDEVFADDALLSILSSNPSKPPHEFGIHKLRLRSVGPGQPMSFAVTLTIPTPVGQVQSSGQFGPWKTDDPSLTPVSGNYTFSDADLGTIRGLGGTLSSHGGYKGVLSEIGVEGVTDTPNFDLGVSGNPVHLKTQFTAVVDGVSGDTLLQSVNAQLLGSKIAAHGQVVRAAGRKGKRISLDVTAQPARLEDLLRLAVKSPKPSMTGAVTVHTKFDLQPGEEEIVKRLKLNGGFTIQSALFTDPETEAKITGLSRRGQGKPGDQNIQNAPFDMQGNFVLANSQATFSKLSFSLTGASLELQGAFGLLSQSLDFHGTLRLQAKVSQTTTGFKSKLLKAIDPLFERKGAGTVIPIKIAGTREAPAIRVEIGKIFSREE